LDRLSLAQPQQLIGTIYRSGLDRTALAALAPIVFEAADSGDEIAAGIVARGAEELAAAVHAAARQLNLASAPLPLALAGGVLLASPSYQEKVRAALAHHGMVVEPVTLVREPAEGAVRLALELRRGLATDGTIK
jgi:N-acetylglucosamine kinase-like BadF-type ATPase